MLILLLLLASCGRSDTTGQHSSLAEPGATSPPPAQATSAPTLAPTLAPSQVPAATATAAPTSTPSPVPTAALPTAVPPTPTTQPQPTAVPPAQLGDAGTIYVSRRGGLVAVDAESGEEHSSQPGVKPPGTFRVSPDGRLIALLSADASSSTGALTVVSLNGQQSYPIAEAGVSPDLDWAPDSSAIAYVVGSGAPLYPSYCSADSEVWVAELASGERRKLGDGCNPAWSPEGKRIAYVTVSDRLGKRENALMLINRLGQHGWAPIKGTLNDSGFPLPRSSFFAPFWSADGKSIYVLADFSEFAETNWSSIEQVDATQGGATAVGFVVDVIGPSLRPGPNRQRIAFASAGAKGTTSINVHVLQAAARSWNPPWQPEISVTLRDREGPEVEHALAAAWSPDGQQLALLYCSSPTDPVGLCPEGSPGQLRLLDVASGQLSEPLLDGIDVAAGVDWAP